MKYIDRMGIEFEGAWAIRPSALKGDGSVHAKMPNPTEICTNQCHHRDCIDGNYCGLKHHKCACKNVQGECVSPPLQFEELIDWIPDNIPTLVDASCGTHIHFSLKSNSIYSMLASKSFYDYFLQIMDEWGKSHKLPPEHQFWHRLEGKNHYCQRKFLAHEQLVNSGDRYTHLNYCYGKHKTIECRLFPGFSDKDLAISAASTLAKCVEDYLDNIKADEGSEMVIDLDVDEELICQM